ncbi:TPA: tyrosine-type recombinase/integrase [Pseudomonas aeruginosa]|nr:tyrosine-type recombinase/integrase [Pseudomonas aeruginosa]
MNHHVTRYIAIKHGLGYKFAEQEQTLRKFAAYADAQGDVYVSSSRIIEWASTASSAPRSREWISVVRAFSVSMHAEDDRHEIVPRDVFGRGRRQRPRPHILAEADIGRIMQAALSLPPPASLTPYTYHYLIGLLGSTGLRVSEAVALLGTDLTADGLVVRETKFRKTRLVPIDLSTRKALAKYLVLRRQIGGADPHLFVLSTGEPPDPSSVSRTFIKLARRLGLRGEPGVRGPRLHDLRHSFAVRSLERCSKDRKAIDRHMLALSTYLGHACLSDTYWYLEATPVLTQQIAHETEAHWTGGRP